MEVNPNQLPRILETLLSSAAQMPTGREKSTPSTDRNRQIHDVTMKIQRPLRNEWQRKWLTMDAYSPDIQILADFVEAFAGRFAHYSKQNRHAVVVGATGIGKTHAAKKLVAWAEKLKITLYYQHTWKKIPRIEFFQWNAIALLSRPEFQLWVNDRTETDLIVLDDVGAESDTFKSGEPTARLGEFLDTFSERWLFVTTNIPVEKWNSVWDARVADRLFRNSQILTMKEKNSYAIQKYL